MITLVNPSEAIIEWPSDRPQPKPGADIDAGEYGAGIVESVQLIGGRPPGYPHIVRARLTRRVVL